MKDLHEHKRQIGSFFVKSLYEVGMDELEAFARKIMNEALEEAAVNIFAGISPELKIAARKIRALKTDAEKIQGEK